MMVREATRDHLPWLAERAGLWVNPGLRAIEAVDADGRIHGMVGFDGWTKNAVCLHIALENPASLRSLMQWGFRAAFTIAGMGVALCPVSGKNARSLHLVARLGFRPMFVIPDGLDVGEDLHWFMMRREECRYLQPIRKAA